jgi:hypothetical protein
MPASDGEGAGVGEDVWAAVDIAKAKQTAANQLTDKNEYFLVVACIKPPGRYLKKSR